MYKLLMMLCGCVTTSVFAQQITVQKEDILKVQLYENLFYENGKLFYGYEENLNEKLELATAIKDMSIKLAYKKGIADGYNCIGLVYMFKNGKANTALQNFYSARDIFGEIGDSCELGGVLCNLGIIYYGSHWYRRAMETLSEAKATLKYCKDSSYLANTFLSIGDVFLKKRKYSEALENYFAAKSIFEKSPDKRGLAIAYIKNAGVFLKQKKFDDAESYAATGLSLAKETSLTAAATSAAEILEHIHKRRKI